MHDLFTAYFEYVKDTEPPLVYHRWAMISSIGALLGRNFYMKHGHWNIYPNLYTMFIGSPGARKSTAIKMVKKILQGAGYEHVAADKTTKEKFLVDLDGTHQQDGVPGEMQKESNLFGLETDNTPREAFIMADEFNNFIGVNNLDFISLLGEFWDYDGVYSSKTKHGKQVIIPFPTISILGGNTQQNFATAFPPEIMGQGFLSRLLLIHGEQTDRRITFPTPPNPEETEAIVSYLKVMQQTVRGEAVITPEAYKMLDEIYQTWSDLEDVRFKHYSTRRFTMLLRLVLIMGAARLSCQIEAEDILMANTILAAAEHHMPTALGEFGKSRNSDTAQIILELLSEADKPMSAREIWKFVSKDLSKQAELGTLLQGLVDAEKLVHVASKGFLTKAKRSRKQSHVKWDLLTAEERKGLGS